MESTSAKRHLMPLAYGRARATDGADAREAEAEPLHSRPERVKATSGIKGSYSRHNRVSCVNRGERHVERLGHQASTEGSIFTLCKTECTASGLCNSAYIEYSKAGAGVVPIAPQGKGSIPATYERQNIIDGAASIAHL